LLQKLAKLHCCSFVLQYYSAVHHATEGLVKMAR